MELKVFNKSGEETGRTVALAENIYQIDPNDHLIYLDVKQYLANQRQGTHKSKERAEIVGSTRKLKKQKGTGTARAGSIKSPIFRGGGRIFGPRPRDYAFKLNKKMKQLARKSALSHKAKDEGITVLENFDMEKPKTQDYLAILKGLALADNKTLVVLPEYNKNIYLSSRNLSKTKVLTVDQLNTYEILHADKVVLFEGAIAKIEEFLN